MFSKKQTSERNEKREMFCGTSGQLVVSKNREEFVERENNKRRSNNKSKQDFFSKKKEGKRKH